MNATIIAFQLAYYANTPTTVILPIGKLTVYYFARCRKLIENRSYYVLHTIVTDLHSYE